MTNFIYSSENQLLSFKVYAQGSATPYKTVTYVYDAMGRRISKIVDDNTASSDPTKTFTRRYAYDGQAIIDEYDGSNSLLAHYTHSMLHADSVLAVDVKQAGVDAKLAQSAQSYEYLKDAQGTVTSVTDTSGNLVMHYIYSAFGMLLGIQDANAADVTANPPLRTSYTFTGREYDSESGLYYYRARYYDPKAGRFLQEDPDPGKLDLSSSIVNRYVYAGNNPANVLDPSGKSFWGTFAQIAIGVVIAAAVVFTAGAASGALVAYLSIQSALAGVVVGAVAGAATGAIRGAMMGTIAGGIAGYGASLEGYMNNHTTMLAASQDTYGPPAPAGYFDPADPATDAINGEGGPACGYPAGVAIRACGQVVPWPWKAGCMAAGDVGSAVCRFF